MLTASARGAINCGIVTTKQTSTELNAQEHPQTRTPLSLPLHRTSVFCPLRFQVSALFPTDAWASEKETSKVQEELLPEHVRMQLLPSDVPV